MLKKCKKVLIFTRIFTLKTNMSYNSITFSLTNRPIFKIFVKNPCFLTFSSFFLPIWLRFLPPINHTAIQHISGVVI